MPPRRLRIVSSSSDEDDNDNVNDAVSRVSDHEADLTGADTDMDNNSHSNSSINIDLQSVSLISSHTPQNHQTPRPSLSPIPLHISSDEEEEDPNIFEQAPPVSNFSNQVPTYSNLSPQTPTDDSVSGVLLRLGLKLKAVWLDSCLIGLSNSIPGFSSLDNTQKAKLCFEQFLNADMNLCGAGVLPENLHSLHLVDLKGPFILQVDEIVNISSPLRGRYQKAGPGIKRCLKLSMTDGTHRIFGIEYRSINALDVFSPAGLKVAICNIHVRRGILMLVPEAFEVLGGSVEELESARQRVVQEMNKPPRGKRTRNGVVPTLATRATLSAWPQENIASQVPREYINVHTSQEAETNPFPSAAFDGNRTRQEVDYTTSNNGPREDTVRAPAYNRPREDIAPSAHDHIREPTNNRPREDNVWTPPYNRSRPGSGSGSGSGPREDTTRPARDNISSTSAMDIDEIQRVPHENEEIPFTYMSKIFDKWGAKQENVDTIHGKIKCFMTGVKGFKYKGRIEYELHAYIDDGSLISEILIHHNVVEKGIGYTPQEVTSALASSDEKRSTEMKEKLKQFQILLMNFEGTMIIEITQDCPSPVAIEMNQGCSSSDALLLLNRLKSQNRVSDFIDLSP